MAFDENLPEWNKIGTEPPQTKKDEGFQPGEKPPAQWFNWLFNKIYKALQEIQGKAETIIGAQSKANTAESNAKGYVDEKVKKDVPADAVFTDTIYNHPNHTGDVTSDGDGATTIGDAKVTTAKIANSNVTNAKLANMGSKTIKGNKETTSGASQDLSASEVRTILNVEEGANKYTHPTGAGNKHVPTGGAAGQVLKYAGTSGTAKWEDETVTEIEDSLISSSADKALSAKQGKALSDTIGPLANLLTTIKTSIVNAINSLKEDVDEHKAEEATEDILGHIKLSDVPSEEKMSEVALEMFIVYEFAFDIILRGFEL